MTKKNTNIVKGIAILLVYAHHLFYNLDLDEMGVIYGPVFRTGASLNMFGFFAKVCVSMFVFLSAYGTFKSFASLNVPADSGRYLLATSKNAAKRYVKLLLSFQFVWILAVVIGRILGHSMFAVFGGHSMVGLFNVLIDFFGVSNIVGTPTYNGTWWYMSYALMLAACMPLFSLMCIKLDGMIMVVAFFLIRYLAADFTFSWYMLTVFAGILFAKNSYFERINKSFGQGSLTKKIGILVGCAIALAVFIRMRCVVQQCWDLLEMLITVLICVFVNLVIGRIPVLNTVLAFLGKHSMNMFLTHSFIFYYWFRNFTYSFRHPALIMAVLVAETLAVSVVVELLKKVLRLDKAAAALYQKLEPIMFHEPIPSVCNSDKI